MAEQFARWHPAMAIVSLRFSNVYSPADYGASPAVQADPASRKWNLWSYIDADDAAQACRCALEAKTTGHEPLIIAAADNLMGQPSHDLMADHFPGVPLAETLLGEFLAAVQCASGRI